MRKIHTRMKRRHKLSRYKNWYYEFFHPEKRIRPKTFKTEQAAHAWASNNDLKPEQYLLKPAKKNKKFQIVIKDGKNKNTAS